MTASGYGELPGYDAWKLETPPGYDALECEGMALGAMAEVARREVERGIPPVPLFELRRKR